MAPWPPMRWPCTRPGASRPDDVLLHALPVFHVHGLFVALHCALLSGCPMVWLPKFVDAEVLAGLDRATVMMGVPTFYTRLLANPGLHAGEGGRHAAVHLRLGAAAALDLRRLRGSHRPADPGALRDERGGDHHHQSAGRRAAAPDRSAIRCPGVELRIGGRRGRPGCCEIRGPSVFSGYWRMPEKTAEEFTADGFFITGDVGRRDPDGRVWISGRAKDLIISGGYNVYPKEVELVLDELSGRHRERGDRRAAPGLRRGRGGGGDGRRATRPR